MHKYHDFEKENIDPVNAKFNPKLKTVLFVLRDTSGCGFYRCLQPALALRRRGLMNTITDVQNTTREHIMQADLVVIQSPGAITLMQALNFALEQKKPVIVEIDDFLHSISPYNPGYEAWRPETLYLHRFVEACKRAQAMTVSTPQLAREYGVFNKNIYVLPNYLNEDKWTLNQTKQQDGIVRIGWAGGNAHIQDLEMVVPVIQKIIKEYKGKVKFESMGLLKQELKAAFPLVEYHDKCPSCGFQGECVTHAGEHLDNYPQVLASHGWDIAIAPVVNNAFNNCKSDLKLKEYSAVGFPTVASSVTPYEEAKDLGCDVLLAKNFEEWYNNIKTLIDNPEKRTAMVRKNSEWIKSQWIDENATKYFEVYSRTIEQFGIKSKKSN